MTDRTLLINNPFALRQWNGQPVYTDIKNEIAPLDNENLKCFDKLITEKLANPYSKKRVKLDHPLDLHNLERIIITPNAKGYLSTAFIEFAKKHSIPIYWIDQKGKLEASFIPFNYKKPSLIMKQVESRINGKALKITKYLIKLKLESQGMKDYITKLNKARNIKEIMQIEAGASNIYFRQWIFNKEWNWKGRYGKASGNKNAVDPVNATLNLGYGLLAQRMSELLLKRGFELSIGFMHQNEAQKPYWNMLAYDFIEPFRTWIDGQVMEMISGLRIKPDDFTFTDDKTCMTFKDNAFDIALDEFMYVLNPLESKSLPVIREIENML